MTYTTTITNSGQTAYTTARFIAPLVGITDDAVYNNDATATNGTASATAAAVSWVGALAVGGAASVTYSVTVSNPVTGNFRLEQTVTSANQGSICPVGGIDPRCTTAIFIAGLHIVTLADVSTSRPTGVIRYTNTFVNTGQVAYVGISIDINVLGAADDTAYNGDATATSGSVAIATGNPIVRWTGDLPVGGTVVMTSSVTVRNPDPGDRQVVSFVTTAAPGSNCPVGNADPACLSTVQVLIPGLTISKVATATVVTPGSLLTYTITAANTGATDYTAATITDSLVGC